MGCRITAAFFFVCLVGGEQTQRTAEAHLNTRIKEGVGKHNNVAVESIQTQDIAFACWTSCTAVYMEVCVITLQFLRV